MTFFVPWTRVCNTDAHDDTVLLAKVAECDQVALEVLYRREAGAVYRYVLALCGNAAWAADATQEAFVALATRSQTFNPQRGSLGAWLAGIARHALQAIWREVRLEEAWPEDDEAMAGVDGSSPESILVDIQETAVLWSTLRELPAPFREAVILVDLQERSYAEAAQIAGVEINTLRTRLHRARVKLAVRLAVQPGRT